VIIMATPSSPNAPARVRDDGTGPSNSAVALLLQAGADPNDTSGGGRPETPLHWAASTDDVEVAVALIDGGADLQTPGGSIGTPLDNAIGYGCWHVARLLLERGAPVHALWHAAALGMLTRLEELLAADPPPDQEDLNAAFWQACHGGQRRSAERLLAAGATINAAPPLRRQPDRSGRDDQPRHSPGPPGDLAARTRRDQQPA
jgi:hypothetical protein